MSVHLVPRWQRTVLRWFLERQLRKGVRSLPCPQCQGSIPIPHRLSDEILWEAVVTCPACGHACSVLETASYRHKRVKEEFTGDHIEESPPATSHIHHEHNGATHTWKLPAPKSWNPLLKFGTLWTAFCAFVAFAILSSEKAASQGYAPPLIVVGFVLLGVGLLIAGLLHSFSSHVLSLDASGLVHERNIFGSTKRQFLPREDIVSVKLERLYSQNRRPVYVIEIKGQSGRIRFGSALPPDEKSWLCGDLRRTLLGQRRDPVSSEIRTTDSPGSAPAPRMVIETPGQGCVVHVAPGKLGKGIMIFGSVIFAFTTFLLIMARGLWLPLSGSWPLPFLLIWNGLFILWCLSVILFVGLGLGTLLTGYRMLRTHFKITASPQALQVLESHGNWQHETLVPASDVRDIRTSIYFTMASGSDRQRATKVNHCALIVLQDRVISFGGECSLSELQSTTTALKQALGHE